MADTALEIVNMMIDAMAGSEQPKHDTLVPALLELAGYIGNISGDIGDAVQAWMSEHPELVTTVQDHSLDSDKFVVGLFQQVTTEDISEMIGE